MEVNTHMNHLEPMDVDLFIDKNTSYIYIDVQGFKITNNFFMCKEFCLLDGDYMYHALIKSTQPYRSLTQFYRKQVNWLSNNHHRIKYGIGDVDIKDLKELYPRLNKRTIIVDCRDKIVWVQNIFRECGDLVIENLNELKNSSYINSKNSNQIYEQCEYHMSLRTPGRCAITKVQMMLDALRQFE